MTDDNDFKKRIQAACEKYAKKDLPKPKRKEKNKSPERDLQKIIIKWLNEELGWDVQNVDSSASYSLSAGRYISQKHAKTGTPDIVGNDKEGRAIFIELKAPGRRLKVRLNQRDFLVKKIHSNCFAIVADSKEYISNTYNQWLTHQNKKEFLLNALPPEKLTDDDELFPSDE